MDLISMDDDKLLDWARRLDVAPVIILHILQDARIEKDDEHTQE